MEQNYSAVLLKPNWKYAKVPVTFAISPSSFNASPKLTNFYFIGDEFMNAIEALISTNFNGSSFALVGNLANNKRTVAYPGCVISIDNTFEKNENDSRIITNAIGIKGYKSLLANKTAHIRSVVEDRYEQLNAINGLNVQFELNMYESAEESMNAIPAKYDTIIDSIKEVIDAKRGSFRYAVNCTKGEFVAIPKQVKKRKVHPLALLCLDASGEIEYEGEGMEYVGSWAYDNIMVTTQKPIGGIEITPKFKDNYL